MLLHPLFTKPSYLMASLFHTVSLCLFVLKYFLWRCGVSMQYPRKQQFIFFFAFSASSTLLTLYFLSEKYLLTHHQGRMILWLRCKMVAMKSCSAFSHPVFSIVVVLALSQVHCLTFPKSSDLFIPSEKGGYYPLCIFTV